VLIALSVAHLVLLHENGSTNPLGVCCKIDMVRFYPKFITKDIFGFLAFVGSLVLFTVFFYPNDLGHPDNYIRADALITPKHIVPE
jgi:ubiquinol-cytochrome c reductase cytochrome b subunit